MVQYDCTKSGHAFEKMDFEIEVCILFSIVYNLYTSQGSTGAENTRTCQTPKNIQMKKMNLGSRTVCVSPQPPLWITELFRRWNFTVERIFRAIVGTKWREELCQPWFLITSCTVVHWKPGIIVSS